MRRLLLLPLAFYLVALLLGLALRFFFVHPFGGIDFGHAVHAHSHTLYFGWLGLGLATLAFRRLPGGRPDRNVRRALGALVLVSAATFVAFLHSGYGLPGIVVSTLALVAWGAIVLLFLRRAKGERGVEIALLRAGMLYVALASLGACARVAILALGISDPLPGKLAVFAFLHDFAFFFVFASLALVAWQARLHGAALDERLLRLQLRWTVPVAWLTFPLGVQGGTDGWLGWTARIATLLLLVPAAIGCRNLWGAARRASGWLRPALRWLAFWFGLQAAMQAVGALGFADLALQSRHLAILYLHVLLVGFVGQGLAVAIGLHLGAAFGGALRWHNLGLATMAVGLGCAGGAVVGLRELAPAGLWLAVAGGAGIVAAALLLTRRAWQAIRTELPARSGAASPASPT